MRSVLFAAAVATTMSAAAFAGGNEPYVKGTWTNGQYAQQLDGQIGVFPNPASGQANVIYPGLTGKAVVMLVAEDGRVVRQVEVGETNGTRTILDVAGLRNGLYFIRVIQPSGMDIARSLVVAN